MTNFIPEQPKQSRKVPLFDDVTSEDGWQGHTTRKSVDTLKAEITKSIVRLGGIVSGFQSGTFNVEGQKRDGFRINYVLSSDNGQYIPGQIDVAALPVRDHWHTKERRKEQSIKMALYMIRDAIDGLWFLQQLSPGYAPLVPWMLTPDGKTVSQLWSESSVMSNLLPPGQSEFIEGEVIEK